MRDPKQIEKEVQEALNSLDGIEKAQSSTYLFTRVQAQLNKDKESVWSSAWSFVNRPTVAFATIVLTLFVNVMVFFVFRSDTSTGTGEGEQQFANEYNLAESSFYDSTTEPE